MPARPGRRDSCGPRFLTTTSWLPSTSSTCSAMRCCALRMTTTGSVRPVSVPRALRLQQRAEPEERQRAVAERRSGRWRRPARSPSGLARRTISTSVDGTATVVVAAAQHHDLRHRRRQRQHQLEAGALAGGGGGLDAAAHRVDLGAHDVHADAAAGQLGHLVGGGEAGREDQVGELGVASAARRARAGPCATPLSRMRSQVEAGAVVAELDADFVALVAQRDR